MVRSRIAAGLFAASAVIAALMLGAAPVSAATLPSGATITVWGSRIADTGSNGVEFIPIVIGAVLLLLAGVALAVTHRISHRRRNHHHPAA